MWFMWSAAVVCSLTPLVDVDRKGSINPAVTGRLLMSFILALDQGTTSSRAILFDHSGAIRAVAQKEFRQIFPQAGWVEHDPLEIWQSQVEVARAVLAQAGLRARDVDSIGITNQRETTVIWDRR